MNLTLLGFIKKELIQSLRDPRMRIILFVTPMIQLCVFGFALNTEIKNVKIAAVFDDKDYVLRDVYEHSLASSWFIPAKSTKSEPYYLMSTNKADVVLAPSPGGFTKNLGRDDAQLQMLINSTNVIKGQSIDSYLQNIVRTTVEDDLSQKYATNPIQIEQRVLFNPDLNTALFLVPGTMCLIMTITTMMLATLAIVREKEMGTFEMLISAPITRKEIIYGKTFPYIILGCTNFPLVLSIAYFVFDVPIRGPIIILFLATFVFICMSVFLGTFVATFCNTQQQAILAVFLFLFPMIMMSGLMFPIENMPLILQWVAFADPLFHYMGLLRNIMLKGGGANYVIAHVLILAAMAFVTIFTSIRRFRISLN